MLIIVAFSFVEGRQTSFFVENVHAGFFGDLIDKGTSFLGNVVDNTIRRTIGNELGNMAGNAINRLLGGNPSGYQGNNAISGFGTGISGSGGTQIPLSPANYDQILVSNKVATIVNSGGGNTEYILSKQGLFSTGVISFVNRIFVAIAIIWFVILGVKFAIAQGEEDIKKYKKQFGWIVLGLAVISVAQYVAFDVFNPVQDILHGNAAEAFKMKANQIKIYFQIVAAGIALIACVLSGYNLIVGGSEAEALTNEKRFFQSFALGIVLIFSAEVIVRVATLQYYKNNGMGTAAQVVSELAGITNFTLTFLGASAVFMLVLASIYYVTSFGDDAQTGKAKKIIGSCIVAIIVILSSYAFINYFVR